MSYEAPSGGGRGGHGWIWAYGGSRFVIVTNLHTLLMCKITRTTHITVF